MPKYMGVGIPVQLYMCVFYVYFNIYIYIYIYIYNGLRYEPIVSTYNYTYLEYYSYVLLIY